VACHGESGAGGHGGGSTLLNDLVFRDVYPAEQIRDVAGYVNQVLAKKPR
jgi:hypothetical protein